jgi:YidC/Oxa1 family membrane protein insertase
VLPIVFIPFILNFPSGLMIYWLTTNLWTTGQGLVTRKLMPKPDLKALQERRSSRTPPKDDGAAQQSAKAKPKAATSDGATAPADGTRPKVAGPPRRVKKKRSGGGRRR